jgi:Calx-beta domain
VTVAYVTADGTATAGLDYTATAGTLTFAPGATTQSIAVSVSGDALDEPNEVFFLNLGSPVNAIIADAHGTGTIADDDPLP